MRLLLRPELAAVAGAVLVWALFAALAGGPFVSGAGTTAWLNASAPLGILAVAVALLMIAGEFDLSVGSMIGAAGMCLMLLTGRTQIGGIREVEGYESARLLFASTPVGSVRAAVLWWLGCGAVGIWVLRRTVFGNWIFATGGDAEAARNTGVPVTRVKVTLFAVTALAACLVAVIQAVQFGGADALRGQMFEFRAIIAVVIGGTLLTGGYGSVLGAILGALIFGMVQQGLVITGVDADWFQVFLGIMLLVAVVVNHYTRTRLVGAR